LASRRRWGGNYATNKLDALNKQIIAENDPQNRAEVKQWIEGGTSRTSLHAAGATLSAVSMPRIAKEIGRMDVPDPMKLGLRQVASAALGAAVGGTQGMASAVDVEANNAQLHQDEYDFAKKNAKLVAKKLKIGEAETEARILAEMLRNSDKQTADATGGIHDHAIRGQVGCQNLNCDGYKNDPEYANHDYNSQFIKPNQAAYDAGQMQLGTGRTYNQLVTDNIKKDPVGATLAGAGMIGLGVVTGGTLPSAVFAGAGATIGMGVNGGVQLAKGQPFDWFSFGMSGFTGATSSGMRFIPALLINTGGALANSGMQGKNPNGAMASAAVGTTIGYPLGAGIEKPLNSVMNPWYRQQWKDVSMGMSVYVPKTPIPSWFGSMGAGAVQENAGDFVRKEMEKSW
jgi:filamentous hemagglutinin